MQEEFRGQKMMLLTQGNRFQRNLVLRASATKSDPYWNGLKTFLGPQLRNFAWHKLGKIMLLHDNARPYTAAVVKDSLGMFKLKYRCLFVLDAHTQALTVH